METMQKLLHKIHKKKKGFTLIELIVVIAILAILAALLVPAVSQYVKQATDTKNAANARAVYTAAAAYAADQMSKNGSVKRYLGDAELKDYFGETQGNVELRAEVNTTTGAVEWGCYIVGSNKSVYPVGENTSGWHE